MKEIITKKRKELNMTQKELADKLNISDKTLSRWETGNSYPDVTMLLPISKVLGVSVEDLLNNVESQAVLEKKEEVISGDSSKSKMIFVILFVISIVFSIAGIILLLLPWTASFIVGLVLLPVGLVLMCINVISLRFVGNNDKRITKNTNTTIFNYSRYFIGLITIVCMVIMHSIYLIGTLTLIALFLVFLFMKRITSHEFKKNAGFYVFVALVIVSLLAMLIFNIIGLKSIYFYKGNAYKEVIIDLGIFCLVVASVGAVYLLLFQKYFNKKVK